MPLQAAAAAGKTSPRASAPLNPLAPLPAGRPAVKSAPAPAEAFGPAAPGRQWAAAGPVGAVRPARNGLLPPPPLLGLLRLPPAGAARRSGGGGPVWAPGVLRAGASWQEPLEPAPPFWEVRAGREEEADLSQGFPLWIIFFVLLVVILVAEEGS